MSHNLTLKQIMGIFGAIGAVNGSSAVKPQTTEFNLDPLFVSAVKHSVLHNSLELPWDKLNQGNLVSLGQSDAYGDGSLNHLDKILSSPTGQIMILPREQKMADDISQYFQQKYTLNALKDDILTDYHKDVIGFFTKSDRKVLTDREIALVSMLPLFYEYDMKLDKLMDGKTPVEWPRGLITENPNYKLKFLDKLVKKTKSSKEYNYFFVDELNRVFMISLDRYQKLTMFFEHFIKSNEWIEIKGYPTAVKHSYSYGILQFVNKWEPVLA